MPKPGVTTGRDSAASPPVDPPADRPVPRVIRAAVKWVVRLDHQAELGNVRLPEGSRRLAQPRHQRGIIPPPPPGPTGDAQRRGVPSAAKNSLTVNGTPWSGPSSTPRSRAASAANASWRGRWNRGRTSALRCRLTSSIAGCEPRPPDDRTNRLRRSVAQSGGPQGRDFISPGQGHVMALSVGWSSSGDGSTSRLRLMRICKIGRQDYRFGREPDQRHAGLSVDVLAEPRVPPVLVGAEILLEDRPSDLGVEREHLRSATEPDVLASPDAGSQSTMPIAQRGSRLRFSGKDVPPMIQSAWPSQWNQTGDPAALSRSRGPGGRTSGRERNSSRSKISRSPADTFLSTILIYALSPSLKASAQRIAPCRIFLFR